MPDPVGGQALLDYASDPTLTILIHLGKNNNPPEELECLLLADIEECTFPGYAPIKAEAFALEEGSDDTAAIAKAGAIQFVSGAVTEPQLVTFAYTTFKTGAEAACLGKIFPFAQPLTVDAPNQTINRVFSLASVNFDG